MISDAILRSRAASRMSKTHWLSFLFLGPGVGKTELAKALAENLFDDEDVDPHRHERVHGKILRLPLNRCTARICRLRGRRSADRSGPAQAYSVILFDELEKHPDVFNVLLQILDDGRVTDSQGRTVDFKNTILIMTSNLGSSLILENITDDGTLDDSAKEGVRSLLRGHFRPEFLNRIDETVFFTPLTRVQIRQIIHLQMARLKERLAEKQLDVELTNAAEDRLMALGYDPVYGARPMKRLIQSQVETAIARTVIEGKATAGDKLIVDASAQDGFDILVEERALTT